MTCATGVVKFFVFLANLILVVTGSALIIIGVLHKVQNNEATSVLPSEFDLAPILSIIVGAVIFITASFGCCGAICESPCMLTTYAIILLAMLIVQVSIGVYAFLEIKNEQSFRDTIDKSLTEIFEQYGENEGATETMNVIQQLLHCCGVYGPKDYENKWSNTTLPSSCCQDELPCDNNGPYYYEDPCGWKIYDFVLSSSTVLGAIAISTCIIELIGAFLGFYMANAIRRE